MNESLFVINNFTDGLYVPPSKGKYLDNFNPSTGKVYSQIAHSDKEDVDKAVTSAKKAFKTWSKTSRQERSKILNKIADLIEVRLLEFAEAESIDQGKPVTLAKTVDIPRVVSNFRYFAGIILYHQENSTEMEDLAINYTQRVPAGVAGLISPWNLPLYLLTWKIAPALAVGDTIVCKPSEFASVTAWKLCTVLNEAGVPHGVCNMVFGLGSIAGAALVQHPDVPLISFTGGTATAEHIIRDSAPYAKKLYLELGGKNPCIIFDDANLEECVSTTVRSSFSNQGEICLCGSRIFVQEGIYDKFIASFVESTKKLVVGDPSNPKTQFGALVSEEHRKKVEYYLAIAKQEGKILCGGDRPELSPELEGGYFLNPTIVADLPYTCKIQTEEIFGPVVGITKFKTEEEVIEMANSSKYGLAAIVWTENGKLAHRVSLALESGTVWVNCWMVRDLNVPFGGFKQSGLGRMGGSHSLDFYTEQKTICMKYK